jgi:hypothetical protein
MYLAKGMKGKQQQNKGSLRNPKEQRRVWEG